MNTNMIINISIIVGAIAITIINENLKKTKPTKNV